MEIEVIEASLVFLVLVVQFSVFLRTLRRIKVLKTAIPKVESLKVSTVLIPLNDLENLSPHEILSNITKYKEEGISNKLKLEPAGNYSDIISPNIIYDHITDTDDDNSAEKAELNIVECDSNARAVFTNILQSINNYLIRNRDGAMDFNLIKDIVERNTNAIEEDINMSIGTPLYLGLMATMMGIVIALFNMPDLALEMGSQRTGQQLDEGIAMLIGGVKIAMIASFAGLLFTIINSGWLFKGSRNISEERKNEFYTFIQTELLPVINQGLASTLESMQRNLFKFNAEFSSNILGLRGIFDANTRTIKSQKELLDAIDKTKVSEMTRYNVKVLQQLDQSVAQFEKFNNYLTGVNTIVDNTQQIVQRTNELLTRTDNVKKIADNLEERLDQSKHLMEFLAIHFDKLEEHKQFTSNAVADVGDAISDAFKELKVHIQNSSEAVKQFTVEETEALKEALSSSKTNLGNLEHLATLKTDLSQLKNSTASHGERLRQTVEELNGNIAKSIAILEQIRGNGFAGKTRRIWNSLKRLFKSKNRSEQ